MNGTPPPHRPAPQGGSVLTVARHGSLRGCCVVCGQPALSERPRTLVWTPRPRPIFALAARWWFLWMVYALVRRRTTVIRMGYCARHQAIRRVCQALLPVLSGVAMALVLAPVDGMGAARWPVLAGMLVFLVCTVPAGILATEFHVEDIAEDGTVRLAVDPRVHVRVTRPG